MVRLITLYTCFKSNTCLLSWSSWHSKCRSPVPGEWMHPSPLLTALWLPWTSASVLLPCSLSMVTQLDISSPKLFLLSHDLKAVLAQIYSMLKERIIGLCLKSEEARSLSRFFSPFEHTRNIFTLWLWLVLWNGIWRANCSISSAAAKTFCRNAAISEPEGPEKDGCITST